MQRSVIIAAVLLLPVTESAHAGLVNLLKQNRYIGVNAYLEGFPPPQNTYAPDFSDFLAEDSASVGNPPFMLTSYAYQQSTITNDTFSGTVIAQCSSAIFGFTEGHSYMTVEFEVVEPVTYTLTGMFATSGINAFPASPWVWLAPLDESGFIEEIYANGNGSFDGSGVLAPGSYYLYVSAFAGASEGFPGMSVEIQYNLSMAPVPTPGALTMLALGALGVKRRRR